MRRVVWSLGLAVACVPVGGIAAERKAEELVGQPYKLSLEAADESVYALPGPTSPSEGVNEGGVNIDIKLTYVNDYFFRGINRSEQFDVDGDEDDDDDDDDELDLGLANFQLDGVLRFNLGRKLPHPFIGVFTNVLDEDPVSNFQEIRPVVGAEWYLRPLLFAGGNNTYIFPDRDDFNTAEVWGKITLDDAAILKIDEPLLSPYVYGAYDYDNYNGWYLEAGVSHDFVIEELNITLTTLASAAYVHQHELFAKPELGVGGADDVDDSGFHHYQFGLIGRYSLNTLLNIPRRYGTWTINGYVYYTDGIEDDLNADTGFWGGAGIEFSY